MWDLQSVNETQEKRNCRWIGTRGLQTQNTNQHRNKQTKLQKTQEHANPLLGTEQSNPYQKLHSQKPQKNGDDGGQNENWAKDLFLHIIRTFDYFKWQWETLRFGGKWQGNLADVGLCRFWMVF